MKESEAETIIGMIRSATSTYKLDLSTVQYWQGQMVRLDAETATKAVIVGSREWRFFPSWAQFYEVYRAEKRKYDLLSEPVGEQGIRTPADGKRGVAAPEWVWVWSWARMMRDPRDDRSFPQQEGHVDPTTIMTSEEYEQLRAEWVAEGSPKSRNPLPVALR